MDCRGVPKDRVGKHWLEHLSCRATRPFHSRLCVKVLCFSCPLYLWCPPSASHLHKFLMSMWTFAEDCVDPGIKVESVFTIPGEAAMLTCHLDKNVTDSNISWHKSNPDGQLSVDNRWVQVKKNIIWLLRSTLQDSGTYMCILRYVPWMEITV